MVAKIFGRFPTGVRAGNNRGQSFERFNRAAFSSCSYCCRCFSDPPPVMARKKDLKFTRV